MPQGEQKYDATKRRSWRQAVKTKLHMVQQWREGTETADAMFKLALAGGIVGFQTYLLRLVVVPTPGLGQITLPDGRAAFLTYKGKQIQTIQWTFPDRDNATGILQMALVILLGGGGGGVTLLGELAAVLGTGAMLSSVFGGGAHETSVSIFRQPTLQLNDIYVDMGSPPQGPGPSPVEIKVDTWVALKRAKYFGFALGVGAMSYFAWTKMGGALLR